MTRWRTFAFGFCAAAALGCGSRDDRWDPPPRAPAGVDLALGMTRSVVLLDDAEQRAVILRAEADQLTFAYRTVGRNVLRAEVAPDRSKVFVLSSGVVPRRTPEDETASLTVIDDSADLAARRYDLPEPLSGLQLDPLGEWAVVHAGTSPHAGGAFVENPNELLLVDLSKGPSNDTARNPLPYTLRSFGAKPTRLTFTAPLDIANAQRRLLLVETDQDLSIVDLSHLDRTNTTVRFTNGTDLRLLNPAGLVVADRDPTSGAEAQIAVRFANDTNIATIRLTEPDTSGGTGNDFAAKINLTDVQGTPGDIAYVSTENGLRLAALVPDRQRAVLLDPATSITSPVSLSVGYQNMSLVTNLVGTPSSGEVALLWGGGAGASNGIAFWSLGTTPDKPYRSVETLPLAVNVTSVIDVPDSKLKVLSAPAPGDSSFFVLDLAQHTAAKLEVGAPSQVVLSIAAQGHQVLALGKNTPHLSVVSLDDLHPTELLMRDRNAAFVFDVERDDGSGHSIVAIHPDGNVGATVFDGATLDSSSARLYSGLLLGGLAEGTSR